MLRTGSMDEKGVVSEQVPLVMYCVTLEFEVMNQPSDPHPVFAPQSNGSVVVIVKHI